MLKLPNGSILMHGSAPYDPAKARAYYLRTRKLKGRKKGSSKLPEDSSVTNQKKYRAKLDAFLKKLPMAVEGASLKDTEKFVDEMRSKSDSELLSVAAKIRKEKGNNDGAQVATINALIANRNRVRKQRSTKRR